MLGYRWSEFVWSISVVYILFAPLAIVALHFTAGFYGALVWWPMAVLLILIHILLPFFGDFEESFPFMVYPVAIFVIESFIAQQLVYTDPDMFEQEFCIYLTYLVAYFGFCFVVYQLKRKYFETLR